MENNKKKDCSKCLYIQKAIDLAKIKEGKVYYNDEEYGDRLQISIKADKTGFKNNLRVAKSLLNGFPEMKVKFRPHIRVKEHKNLELEIEGLIADNKKIEK